MTGDFLLKRYSVEELKAGMVVGRSVYDEQQKELVAEGTILTNQLIFSMLDRPIFSVLVREEKVASELIDQHVLDTGFVNKYEAILQQLRGIFDGARKTGQVDVDGIRRIVRAHLMELVDGLKAINHVHNIYREGAYLLHHSINVAILSGVLGQWLNFPPDKVEDLVCAGLMHDIGKTQVPLEILDKPGRLSDEEMAIMRRHSARGFDLMRYGKLKDNKNVLFGILQHHERMDGSGYPGQVKGDEIVEFGRIIAIADVYDAMAANKVYARKQSPFDIFNLLADEMTTKLDTKYCVLFIKNICHSLNGNWVELSTGEKAKIIYIDESRIKALPVVQCEDGKFVDLNREPVKITKLLSNAEVAG